MSVRHKPAALAVPGDLAIVDGTFAEFIAVHTYAPGQHPAGLAVYADHVARVVITTRGTRVFGHRPGERYRGVEISTLAPEGISFE